MAINLNEKYQPLFQNAKARYIIITGGRGSAKSFSVSTFLNTLLCANIKHKILFTRYTMTAAHISIIPEFSEKIELLGLEAVFDVKVKEIVNNKTDNEILFRGIKTSSGNQTASLKSIQGITVWVLDEAEELVNEEIFDKIDLSIRQKGVKNLVIIVMNKGSDQHWIIKRFFTEQNVPEGFNGYKNNILYIHTTYLDNLENLNKSFIDAAENCKKNNPIKYDNIFLGHATSEISGALWKQSTMIDPYRVFKKPELKRIVVAVDPSVSSSGKQDTCGIVVVGQDFNNEFYILHDATAILSPAEWGKIAVANYKNFEADNIIAESNQGGDLVKMNIKNIDRTVPVKLVRATRGKLVRAEPIAALYEEGRVHHVGRFPELELQLTTYVGEGDSPGNFDAAIWGLAELSQNHRHIGIRSF